MGAIARRLAVVRADSGLNQGQFAERLGFPKRTYLGWERAETEPPIWLLTALRREFDIDPDWVLNGPGDQPRRHAGDIDWKRLQRVQEHVGGIARDVGLELTCNQMLNLARAVFEQAPSAEADELARMRSMLKVLASEER